MNSFKQFESFSGSTYPWPLTSETILSFISWIFSKKNLKSSTVDSYLASLKFIHSLKNLPTSSFNNQLIKTVLRGKENLEIYSGEAKATRKVMTLSLLKITGHEISKTNWTENSKQTVWAAFTLAFFGCFRMGEILPQNENSFSPEDTLLWRDLNFKSTSHILVHIKTPKSRLPRGEYVDIFNFTGHSVCPVAALSRLKDSLGSPDLNSPVFRFSTGVCLTRRHVNSLLPQLLSPHIGKEAENVSGHSFRAGIPAALASHPELATSSDIMGWGRWRSDAYLTYTRLKLEQKKNTFSKISDILNK